MRHLLILAVLLFGGSVCAQQGAGNVSGPVAPSGSVFSSGSFTANDIMVGGPNAGQIQDSSHSALTYIIDPKGLNFSSNAVMTTGGATAANTIMSWFGTVTGTCDTAPCGVVQLQSNSFAVHGVKNPSILLVTGNIGGASQIGGAVFSKSNLNFNATSGNSSGGAYQASGVNAVASANDNGTGGSPKGNLYATANSCELVNGATFWNLLACEENDVDIETGSSIRSLVAHSVVLAGTTAVAASVENIAYDINAGAGATGIFDCGFCFGSYQSHIESTFAAGASLMAVRTNQNTGSSLSVTNGIHFNSNVSFSGNAFDSPSYSVNGSGAITGVSQTLTGAAPTVSSAQVGMGGTVSAAGANTCPSGTVGGQTVQGCLIVNVAGTTRYVPFF